MRVVNKYIKTISRSPHFPANSHFNTVLGSSVCRRLHRTSYDTSALIIWIVLYYLRCESACLPSLPPPTYIKHSVSVQYSIYLQIPCASSKCGLNLSYLHRHCIEPSTFRPHIPFASDPVLRLSFTRLATSVVRLYLRSELISSFDSLYVGQTL